MKNRIRRNNINECRKCGAKLEGDPDFCTNCGAKLFIICRSCGIRLKEDLRFCPNCGVMLK